MEVECEFSVTVDGAYICETQLSVKFPGIEVVVVKGEHAAGKSNVDVTRVQIMCNAVDYFPKGLGKFFPNTKFLRVTACGLKMISRDDLVGFVNLKEIFIECNELTSLPNDLFQGMTKLKTILFNNNKLATMSSKLLKPIKKQLKTVNFHGNTKINASFGCYCDSLPTIEQLMELIDKSCDAPEEVEELENNDYNIAKGLAHFWLSQRFSDFIISVGLKEFPAHKLILASQSSVFAAMFENDMKENIEGKMNIEEISAAGVEDFLRCLYTGEIQDETNAIELFVLAAKYDVQALKTIAEGIILRNVDEKNAADVLNLANLYGSEKLKKKSFKEIQKMFPEVALAPKLKNQPEEVKEMIDRMRIYKQKVQEVEKEAKRKKQEIDDEFAMICKKFKNDE